MKAVALLIVLAFNFAITFPALAEKELPKIAILDLEAINVPPTHAKALTSILVSETARLGKYEVYNQEKVHAAAGWNARKGCTDTPCLKSLGQIGITKLVTGSVGKVGNTYAISLNLLDTQSGKIENGVSEACRLEDDLVGQFQKATRQLFGVVPQASTGESRKDERELTDQKFTNSIGMQFIRIGPGKFIMGSPKRESGRRGDEGPQHEVEITRPFYMSIYEVTQGQYLKIMRENPSFFKNCGSNCPVERMTWKDVQEFINRLNVKEKTDKYRLPTEAEWEYACRAGSKSAYNFGDDPGKLGDYAWYKDNATGTSVLGGSPHPVGLKKPNGWGLYDMLGNVSEWVEDWYGNYENKSVIDPVGPDFLTYKVYRGGSWWDDGNWGLRCASRGKDKFDNWDQRVGFRLVRMP